MIPYVGWIRTAFAHDTELDRVGIARFHGQVKLYGVGFSLRNIDTADTLVGIAGVGLAMIQQEVVAVFSIASG